MLQLLGFIALKSEFLHGSLCLFGKAYVSNEQLDEALHTFKPFSRSTVTNYSLQDCKKRGTPGLRNHIPVQDFLLEAMIRIYKAWKGQSVNTDLRVCVSTVPDHEN